jgi:eukaryotic-like serine/threonine-protein kinase
MGARRSGSRVGKTLKGKWHLDAEIGTGGMATVFRATHRNGSRAALKILHPHVAAMQDMRDRFLREGYVANRVDHPGVVRVLDDDEIEEEGLVFLVMELLEGQTLKDLWSRSDQKLPVDVVVDVTLRTLDVLVAAHAKGIVHRDIKPDNIFLTTDGALKILDFGIARLREGTGKTHATETGATLGTPAFMAPEQARSRWDEIDARCDLFAVGATMWTMLTGRLVHEAKTLSELLVAAATEQVAPIATLLPTLPPEVAKVIDRSLRFDRVERWPDAISMRAALSASAPQRKEASRTRPMAAVAPEPAAPPAATSPAAPPPEPSFAPASVTAKLLAAPLPTLPTLPSAVATPTALPLTQHAVAADRSAAEGPRVGRAWLWASAAGAALLLVGWIAWRSPPRAEPVKPAAPVFSSAPAPIASAPPPEPRAPEPVVTPVEPASAQAPSPTPSDDAPPASGSAASAHRPIPPRPRAAPPVHVAPPAARDPASVFGTH